MPSTRGIPLAGDRSAFDTVNYASLHALDIRNLEFVVHVPQPTARLNVPIADDELHWEARLLTEDDISDLTHLDADAIHDNVAHEIDAITELTTMNSLDVILVESAANNYAKRSVVVGNMLTASSIFDLSDVTAVPTPGDGDVLVYDNVNKDWRPGTPSAIPRQTVLTFSGELEVADNPLRIYNSFGVSQTISKVFLSTGTAPTGASVIVDVHKNGTTIFTTQSNRPEIAAGANTGSTTTIDVPTWADGEYLTAHIDQIGSTVAGSDLVVHIIHR